MLRVSKGILLLLSSAAIVACAPVNNTLNKGMSALDWEAGAEVDEGNFGNPTTNNLLAQVAYGNSGGLMMDLAQKFEQDVPTTITFAFNSAKLDQVSKVILAKQASWIKQFPEIKFRVYGHTDLVGSTAYNQSLGLRRANAVVSYLIAQGIASSRLEAVASFGETQPLIVTQGRERKNRRTVTEVVGFARDFEGDGLDGKYADLIYRRYVTDTVVTEPLNSTE